MFSKIKKYRAKFFDILIMTTFAVIAASLFLLLFRTKKERQVVVKVYEESVVWPNKGVSPWFANLFYQGMEEKNSLGKPMAEVVGVRSYDTEPAKKAVYLTLKLKTVFTPGERQYTYKGKNVLIGSTISLFLDQVFVEGLITDIEEFKKPYPQVKLIVNAKIIKQDPTFPETTGVDPYIAAAINQGDQIKDSLGKAVLKVTDKKVEAADKIVVTDRGEVFLQKDPVKKDVYLTLEVLASKINNRYYFFDDIPILIGESIPIHLDKISLYYNPSYSIVTSSYSIVTSVEEVK